MTTAAIALITITRMNQKIPPIAFAFTLAVAIRAAAQSRSIAIDAVQHLQAPVTLAQVEQTFGPAMQGHGPYRWYRCADRKNTEVWFWSKPRNSHSEPKSSAAMN